ncbi:MAG: hypothetical protein O2800_07280 [Planctomycetota bacterium]|nr:hypothetical protein [Planctomycetota bacterium]
MHQLKLIRTSTLMLVCIVMSGCATTHNQPSVAEITLVESDSFRNRPLHWTVETLAERWTIQPPDSEYQGTLAITSRMSAYYAIDFYARGPWPDVATALPEWIDPTTADGAARLLEYAQEVVDGKRSNTKSEMRDSVGFLRAIALLDIGLDVSPSLTEGPPMPIPDELVAAVQGDILLAAEVYGFGWVVVGSTGNNVYDMSKLAGVFDPSGDDSYTWTSPRVGNQCIVDLSGNDRYIGGVLQGPAAAIGGCSVLIDVCGDDHYSCGSIGAGSAVFGLAILLDEGGNDTITGATTLSLGETYAGCGVVLKTRGQLSIERSARCSSTVSTPLRGGVFQGVGD